LLEELDGLSGDNEGLFVLSATNAPWDVDAALRRPGRFDRMMFVAPPDRAARHAILTYHLRDRPNRVTTLDAIAKKTEGWSGADLRLVCEAASELALQDSVAAGRVMPIDDDHLRQSMRGMHSSIGPWFEGARNVVAFANQSGEYDDLALYLRGRQ
jgi:SpoVK/Ycf46/Vps4 family AAA+-type ATPase